MFPPYMQEGHGLSPLMLASSEGKLDIVELLLRYGADPNLQNPVRVFVYLLVLQDLHPQRCIRTGSLSKSV